MSKNQIPEFMMSLLHSSVVHQVALATFQQPTSSGNNNNNNQSPNRQQSKNSNNHTASIDNDQTSALANERGNSSNTELLPLICNTADKATEFYHRLEALGFTLGLRLSERLLSAGGSHSSINNPTSTSTSSAADRPQDEAINLIRSVLWPAIFGKEVAREADPAAAASIQQQAGKEVTSLVYKLIDTDFSWTRSVSLPPDSPSLADPFIRGTQYDILEDASTFASGIKKMSSAKKNGNHDEDENDKSSNNNNSKSSLTKLCTGPNDYVVLLTGMMLGFLSSLGFGSHAERRVFGGDRATVSAQTSAMQLSSNSSSNAATPTENQNGILSHTSSGSAVISRAPTSFVTVRHRLLPREGEAHRPSGMQLKLVVHFT